MADYKQLDEQLQAARAATRAALALYEALHALWKEMLDARVAKRASKYAVMLVERRMNAAWEQYQAARAVENEARAASDAEFQRFLDTLRNE